MNTPLLALPLSAPIPGALKRKRVLLVDTSAHQRDLRAGVMRKLGMEVDCAADIGEARSWWRADLYQLVLMNVDSNVGQRDEFCGHMRRASPPQQLAFLVGKPEYLADAPSATGEFVPLKSLDPILIGDVRAALAADIGDMPQRWGILEASRRISAVRSACNARVNARQNRPDPPRDTEGRPSPRTTKPTTLDDLLREEMQ
jgi:CheY-like chemotaxis protein